jgi:hypothetical protein
MSNTPMPVIGFAMDVAVTDDEERSTTVALLTLESGELTFEFAINAAGAEAMIGYLQQFVDLVHPFRPVFVRRHAVAAHEMPLE